MKQYLSKYNAKRAIFDDIVFASGKEAKRYAHLKLLVRVGEISQLELQKKFLLQDKFFCEKNNEKIRSIIYIADFFYYDKKLGDFVVEDVKGIRTKDYQLKRKMFLKIYGEKYFFKET